MRALENAHILNDLTESQCRSWLYRTAKNIFIDKVRRMANEPMIEEPLKFLIVLYYQNQWY